MANKIVIGLTGNIATGKSLVLRMLQELGATVIDADKLVHQLMRHGESVYDAIVEEFGRYILDENQQISRAKLGRIVFSDPTALNRLEAITHPGVIEEVKRRIESAPTQAVVVEAIKLFESGLSDLCTVNWVVVAAPNVQLQRLVERRRMAPDQAKQRIKVQGSQAEKASKADVIIDNSGALAKTWTLVKNHYLKLMKELAAAPPPAPAPEPVVETGAKAGPEVAVAVKPEEIVLRRAKRENLPGMARLVEAGTHGATTPDLRDMMELLFSRAYLVALVGDHTVGMIGWQTENLVAGLQDFYVLRDNLWDSVGRAMLEKVHQEIDNLSCEVSLVFVLDIAGHKAVEFLESQGYRQYESKKLIQDWREAAVEWQPENSVLLYKKIREQRIMVPM